MQLGQFHVDWIEVEVPDGPNGQVGFYLASSNQQVIPFRAGATPLWIVSNGRVFHWDLVGQATSGDWQLVAYNTGAFPHTLAVHFGVTPTSAPSPTPATGFISAAVLSNQ
jgi:hypothetical protein